MTGISSNRRQNQQRRRNHNRAGVSLLWAITMLIALCAMASLAVDFGRVKLAKTQLRNACDAAALAAGQLALSDVPAARAAAVAVAKANRADGQPVELQGGDVEFGFWDESERTFAPLSSSQSKCNAVRVSAQRSAARGNPLDLPFAKIIGKDTCDVFASAVALALPQRFAMVGLDYIKMGGRSTNSYRTKDGTFSNYGSIASNGDITLTGSSLINGDAFPGVGKRVIGANHVTGSTTPLTRPLVYPPGDAGNAVTVNNNLAISTYLTNGVLKLSNQKEIEIPAGTYYLNGIELQAGSKVTFSGKATVYVNGPIVFKGHASTWMDDPDNLRIIVLGSGNKIELNGGSSLFCDLYAPGSPITMSGNGDIWGAVVGKSIDTTGNAAFHYNLAMRGGVMLVQ